MFDCINTYLLCFSQHNGTLPTAEVAIT